MGRKPLPEAERYTKRALSKRLYQVKWRKAHPEAHRFYYQKKKYGLTVEASNAFLSYQDFKCLLCLEPFDENRRTQVLLDKETGAVSGLICPSCKQKVSHPSRRGGSSG